MTGKVVYFVPGPDEGSMAYVSARGPKSAQYQAALDVSEKFDLPQNQSLSPEL